VARSSVNSFKRAVINWACLALLVLLFYMLALMPAILLSRDFAQKLFLCPQPLDGEWMLEQGLSEGGLVPYQQKATD
jgi:hypothetical protein